MTPTDIEQAVLDLEQIRIVIRAPVNQSFPAFSYTRKAAGSASIAEWLEQRIFPLIGETNVAVVDGTGISPNRRTRMSTLRASYVN